MMKQRSHSPARPLLYAPRLIPPVARLESHQFEDYLYDHGKAKLDLAMAAIRWTRYKQALPEGDREVVDKIDRLFSRKNLK